MLLEIENLDVRYGANHALRSARLELEAGKIVTVLGANGAGKSSLLKAVIGAVPAAGGRVRFDRQDMTGWSTPRRVRSGLVLVPEGRQIFISLTVNENLLMGAYHRRDGEVEKDIDQIYQRFPNLAQRRDMSASVLSGGEQQMLAIGRALLARPRLMMLDEPSLGLSPLLVKNLFEMIAELNREGLTILLVEQNTRKALQIAHHCYVLDLGRIVMSGTPSQLKSDGGLEEAYLGKG